MRIHGRQGEWSDLTRLLADGERFVCVSGPLGVGKTALLSAFAAAAAVTVDVVVADLAGSAPGEPVLTALAHRLGRRGDALTSLESFIGTRRMLLIADHIEACALDDEFGMLLARCPGLTLIVARDRPVSGAEVITLGPLEVPAAGAEVAEIAAASGVQLFEERASRAQAGFVLDEGNAETIAEICRVVGGLPFAIELAAARIAVLTPLQLLGVLRRDGAGQGALTMPVALRSPREQAGALASTYRQLAPREQDLLADLAGFAGAVPITAAVELSPAATAEVLDDLQRLVDLRLVDPCGTVADEAVFEVPAAVRAFVRDNAPAPDDARRRDLLSRWLREAADILAEAGSSERVVQAQILRRDLALVARELSTPEALERDASAAAVWLVECADVLSGFPERVVIADRLERLLAEGRVDALEPSLQARVWLWSSHLLSLSPDGSGLGDIVDARRQRAKALIDEERDPLLALQLELVSVLNFVTTGDMALVMQSVADGVRIARETARPTWAARFEVWLASAAHSAGDIPRAVELVLGALDRAHRVQDPYAIVVGTILLYTMPPGSIPADAPVVPLEAALDLARGRGEAVLERFTLGALVSRDRNAGKLSEAARWNAELLSKGDYSGWMLELQITLVQTALLAEQAGDLAAAARLIGAVRADLDRTLRAMAPRTRVELERVQQELPGRLGAHEAAALVGAGVMTSIPDAAAEALRWSRAHMATGDGDDLDDATPLTPREAAVLAELAQGLTNKEIALRLGVSVKTVMHHSVAIYRKLDVRGRAEATAYAHRQGLAAGG